MSIYLGTNTTEPETINFGSNSINEVYWGNKKIYPVWQSRYIVATRDSTGKIVYSDNGVNWQLSNDSNINYCGSMAFNNSFFISVPNWNAVNIATTHPQFSYNGIKWATRGSVLTMANWMSVAYGNGVFVIKSDGRSGFPQLIATSNNGINWTEQNFNSDIYIRVRFLNGKFFIPPFYSTNGTNWSQGNVTNYNIFTGEITITTGAFAKDVSFGNGMYVAIKQSEIYYSANGINWYQIEQRFSSLNSIAFGNGIFVVAAKNRLYYSTNGLDWSSVSITGDWNSVVFGNDKFVVVASSSNLETNKALYSTNGINWYESILPLESDWGDVYYCQSV
jgi:hypothetical protein